MLRFRNVEELDGNINKQLLNEYRDKICTVKDIKKTFKHIYKAKAQNNDVWRDEYNYLLLTIKRLKQRGCDVRKLEGAFEKYKAKENVFQNSTRQKLRKVLSK